jgi:hypothetical protein
MALNIASIPPNTPTRIRGELQGTAEIPYMIIGQTVVIPRGRSICELGGIIKEHCGKVDIPDKFGLEGISHIGPNYLTLIQCSSLRTGRPKYICIHNLTPLHSISLCYYLTGSFMCPSVIFLETVLAVEAGSVRSRIAPTQYASRLKEVIEECIKSEKVVC